MYNRSNTYFNQNNYGQQGFSLVEIMIGLVIGLLATLVIMQTFSTFEGQKRTTSGSADAQTNGSIGLMNIQRNVQQAGYGLPMPMADANFSSLRCNAFGPFTDPVTLATTDLFPIVIQNGAANASDTIIVRYGSSAMGGVPVGINNAANAIVAAGLSADNNIGCNVNDIALINNGGICRMAKVTGVIGDANIRLHASTPVGSPLTNGAKIACMGNWQDHTYQIVDNELQFDGTPIVSEVINMQAQYGVSASAGNNQVTQWVDATGGTWAAPTVANRNRIKAIRVALVVRNNLLEKGNVTATCTTANGVVNSGPCAWDDDGLSDAPVIDLSGNADWQRYRYRTFETIIPLRNILWSKDAA